MLRDDPFRAHDTACLLAQVTSDNLVHLTSCTLSFIGLVLRVVGKERSWSMKDDRFYYGAFLAAIAHMQDMQIHLAMT